MVIIRSDVKMKKGKKGAQIGHAALGAYRRISEDKPDTCQEWENLGSYIEIIKGK